MGPAAPILISLEDFGVQDAARSPRRSARMVNGREIVTALIRPLIERETGQAEIGLAYKPHWGLSTASLEIRIHSNGRFRPISADLPLDASVPVF